MRVRVGWLGVILVAMILAGCGASTGGTVGSGTGGATPTASSGPATMQSLGWTKASLKYPDAVAAAPSDPSTLYSCTGDPSGSPNPANSSIHFNVSHDGGTTWQTTNTLAQAGRCESMEVSPTDPQAVAFFAETCRQDCGQAYSLLYVSLDGGAHWSAPALPSAGPIAGILPYGWVGTTLFVAVGDAPPHYLGAIKNGGPFTWVTTTFAPQPFASVGNTLYTLNATMDSSSCPKDPTDCLELARTSDLGASWSRILPTSTAAYVIG
jgi:hypothetical protein